MIAIILVIVSLLWLAVNIWALYKGAKATSGWASYLLWFGVIMSVVNILFMIFILVVPTSSVAKWYNDLKTKAASSTEA